MSQEDIIKFRVALHPSFPDSYSILRISDQVTLEFFISANVFC